MTMLLVLTHIYTYVQAHVCTQLTLSELKADQRFFILEPNTTICCFGASWGDKHQFSLTSGWLGPKAGHFILVISGEKCEFMELPTKPIRDIITVLWCLRGENNSKYTHGPVLRFRSPKQPCNSMVTVSWYTDSTEERNLSIKVYSKHAGLESSGEITSKMHFYVI